MTRTATRVIGGAGSIEGNIQEIEHGSARLAEICDVAGGLALRTAGWGGTLSAAVMSTPTGPALAVRTAQIATDLLWLEQRTRSLADRVRIAAQAYRQVEADVSTRFNQAMVGISAARTLTDLATGQDVSTRDVSRLLEYGPDAAMQLIGLIIPGSQLALASAVTATEAALRLTAGRAKLSTVEKMWLLGGGLVQSTGLLHLAGYRVAASDDWAPQTNPAEHDSTVSWLMDLQEAAAPENAGESAVAITRITRPDGRDAFIVSIPGTQFAEEEPASLAEWTRDLGYEDNAWGLSGMREAMTLRSQHVVTALDQALAQAGAVAGDTVVVTGYSQGGSHAGNFATDPRMNQKYDIPLLVGFAAPDHHLDYGEVEGLTYLGFQHEKDLATALSGQMPTGSLQEARVLLTDLPDGGDPEAGGVFGAGHSWSNLRPMIDTALTDPQIMTDLGPQQAALAGLTAGATGAKTKTFTLTRIPPERPRNPLEGAKEPSMYPGLQRGTVRLNGR